MKVNPPVYDPVEMVNPTFSREHQNDLKTGIRKESAYLDLTHFVQ